MVHKPFCLAAASAAVFLSFPVNVLAMYSKDSPVLQVNAKSYDDLIAKSNHTSVSSWEHKGCAALRHADNIILRYSSKLILSLEAKWAYDHHSRY